MVAMARKRMLPVVGSGEGRSSFIHVDDAAAATVHALDHGAPGIYNITDDHPATASEWIPSSRGSSAPASPGTCRPGSCGCSRASTR